jgi:hypothetical protein
VGGVCSTHGRDEKYIYIYIILVGKPERRNHSEDLGVDGGYNIRKVLRKYWIHTAQDRDQW